jgi:hypothetical protein
MKTNGKHEVIARIAGLGLVLATVLAVVIASSIAGRAQSGATSRAVPTAAPAKAAPAANAGQLSSPAERRPGGNHEGITVHGHWTIEVKNPDGKVVAHREFENSLYPDGASTLAQLLTGTVPFGSWEVILGASDITAGPCGVGGTAACFVGQAGSDLYTACVTTGNCFSTLQVALISASGHGIGNEVQLTGTATATSAGQIGFVETRTGVCASTSSGPSTVSPNTCFAATTLSELDYEFTSATLPTPVPVSAAGQTIAVTVVISFM